jgi:hypothetical protein
MLTLLAAQWYSPVMDSAAQEKLRIPSGPPAGGEYPAFQRQESVFQGFEKFFQNPALYRGLDESIRDGIKANQPQ